MKLLTPEVGEERAGEIWEKLEGPLGRKRR
jgi:hypothetical protein